MTEETNRDRVRRLLFAPLGFRWPKGTDAAQGQAALDGIADELAYLSDAALGALARMMSVHGQGAARCFWPDRASFSGFAHIVQPRPLIEDPKLLSWWASIEGQRMVQDGTLVETYQFFEKRRYPPVDQGPRAAVLTRAKENAARLDRIEERQRLDLPVAPEDADWAAWYRRMRDDLTALVRQAAMARMQKGVAA